MQIPILNGIYTDGAGDFRTSYPVNLVPVPKANGISQGYLRPADGLVQDGTGPGVTRGAISWNGKCYRVMGTTLVQHDPGGVLTTIGSVANGGPVSMDYGFDRLAIASGGKLYYSGGGSITQVTDPDIGVVIDVIWVDGYFMTTDGQFLVVTDLDDPASINPFKYGSSEVDPDPIVAIKKVRGEVHAINRYTIEVFENVGGDFFPFQRIDGALIPKGAIGTHAVCGYADALAFVGGGKDEALGVYIGANGQAQKISTREIDQLLDTYSYAQQTAIEIEARSLQGHAFLYIHLPDRTAVYDAAATAELGAPVWFYLTSALDGFSAYRARHFVLADGQWLFGDPLSVRYGHVDQTISSHYGQHVRWEFGTSIVYNEARGAVFHEMELVALPGRSVLGDSPTVSTSYTLDGMTWSADRSINSGGIGQRDKRLGWLQQGHMRQWRAQRFRGTSETHLSVARLEARIEPLGI